MTLLRRLRGAAEALLTPAGGTLSPPVSPRQPARHRVLDLALGVETRHFDHQAVWRLHPGAVSAKEETLPKHKGDVTKALYEIPCTLKDLVEDRERFGFTAGQTIRYWVPLARSPGPGRMLTTLHLFELLPD